MATMLALAVFSCLANTSLLGQGKQARGASSHGSLSPTEIARRVLPSVVLISCDNGQETKQASGFLIGRGLVLTNFHVIKGMKRGTARTVGGKRRKFRISHVLQVDETSDLALLGIYDAFLIAIPSLSLDLHRDVSVGEAIYAFGNPEGLSGTMSPGIISAGLRKFKDGSSLLQITAPISSGSSGGPIVDAHAQVVGIAMGALKEGQNLNFAVPASSVRIFLNQWYKDNDPKISLWTGLVDLPGEKILDGEWVWLPDSQ